MTMYSSYILQCLMYVKHNFNNFSLNSDCHNHATRHCGDIRLPNHRLSKVSKSYICLSIKFFNKLPKIVQTCDIDKFKTLVKKFLLEKSYYCINDALKDDFTFPPIII